MSPLCAPFATAHSRSIRCELCRLIKQEVYNLVCGVVAPFNRGVEDDPAMDVYEQYRKKP